MSWHTKHFIDEARIAHHTGMRRKKAGRMAEASQSFGQRKLSRGD